MNCPNCGAEMEEGKRRCPACGAYVFGKPPETSIKEKPMLVPFLLGLILNLPGVFIALWYYRAAAWAYAENPVRRALGFALLGLVFPLILIVVVTLHVYAITLFQ